MSTQESRDYQRGYAAGRRRLDHEVRAIDLTNARRERVYLKALELALEHCDGWSINGKKIDNAEGYCTLAKFFADNLISKMNIRD
jgi:hypothetical protein